MQQPDQSPHHHGSWLSPLALVVAGAALATHPLWLPQARSLIDERATPPATICKHTGPDASEASAANVSWEVPKRTAFRLPERPDLDALVIPRVAKRGPRRASAALVIPASALRQTAAEVVATSAALP